MSGDMGKRQSEGAAEVAPDATLATVLVEITHGSYGDAKCGNVVEVSRDEAARIIAHGVAKEA